ncbi:MAG: 6-hydroxycyclohex-1-ene-1-carbonyl-CoA dehydrogenase [Woeseiaceae bacterium]|jgi:6-hydroxycyclohex-1-ene-1-carbonyl-CoA dehydrogenase|nr:6-hydroxycyclohex-1-ene-1-carbonyl-CoA dehydrogenase [Woeseiaceae bacterium]
MVSSALRWVMENAGKPIVSETFDPSSPEPGEVVVEVAGCGVCHTDLGFFYDGVPIRHALPLTLGHEISGRVVAAGKDAEDWLGKAVIIPSVIPCGECDACSRGRYAICPRQKMPGNDIHGGFASHVTVPAFGLCPVDEDRLAGAGLELADVSVVADAVTTPYQAVERSGLAEGDLAIVIGVGGVGGYTVQIANALGATVVAIDVDQGKLDAISDYGAALTLNARELDFADIKQAIRDFASENGLRKTESVVFECSGTAAGQGTAYGLMTFGSTLCVVGFTLDKVEIRLSNLMAFDARVLGNWGCEPALYPAALDLVLDKRIQLLPFVERKPLGEINEVFDAVHSGVLSRRAILVPEVSA